MRKIQSKAVPVLILFLAIYSSGCNQSKEDDEKKKDDTPTQIAYEQKNQFPSQQAKEDILSMPEITDVIAVNTDKEMFMAVKPKHFERFQLKSLRKKIKKQVKKQNPNMDVHVSTDQKIFNKLDELESKLDEPKMDTEKIGKELKKIKKKAEDEA
ncbi:YhcN/YlaJ family sporulation lipoprotein [Metabacillus idriensis]|uniref:YhcN/YlaJ family sporulation lipoprotein n=1 Tax=Metabacillus idriensis TaxID=324768 RepID=UPI00174EBA81|nr:YhcN/YlaJ family sporulation lipoprotein [Metabacillus idriensis]